MYSAIPLLVSSRTVSSDRQLQSARCFVTFSSMDLQFSRCRRGTSNPPTTNIYPSMPFFNMCITRSQQVSCHSAQRFHRCCCGSTLARTQVAHFKLRGSSIQHTIHECTDARPVECGLCICQQRCRIPCRQCALSRYLLFGCSRLSFFSVRSRFRCSYVCPKIHPSPPLKSISRDKSSMNCFLALGVQAPRMSSMCNTSAKSRPLFHPNSGAATQRRVPVCQTKIVAKCATQLCPADRLPGSCRRSRHTMSVFCQLQIFWHRLHDNNLNAQKPDNTRPQRLPRTSQIPASE